MPGWRLEGPHGRSDRLDVVILALPAEQTAPLLEQLARATVGVEIEITSLEGKFKLSQNRSEADVHGVIAGLDASPSAHDHAVADAMRERAAKP